MITANKQGFLKRLLMQDSSVVQSEFCWQPMVHMLLRQMWLKNSRCPLGRSACSCWTRTSCWRRTGNRWCRAGCNGLRCSGCCSRRPACKFHRSRTCWADNRAGLYSWPVCGRSRPSFRRRCLRIPGRYICKSLGCSRIELNNYYLFKK